MRSTHSMAQDTGSLPLEPPGSHLGWSGRLSLRQRILAVNVFALALLAGSFFYLDSYRTRLIDERLGQAASEARLIATAMEPMTMAERASFVTTVGAQSGARVRLADAQGRIAADSWYAAGPSFRLVDPAQESWQRQAEP